MHASKWTNWTIELSDRLQFTTSTLNWKQQFQFRDPYHVQYGVHAEARPASIRPTKKPARFTRLVVKATARHRASKSPWSRALTRRPVAELGRGKGSLHALLPPQPGWRRVVVKARIARHGTADLAAARSHQHYIMRDGVTRDGGPGQLYDREHDSVDGGDFLEARNATPISSG